MKVVLVLGVAALALVGCDKIPVTPQHHAIEVIKARMIDPDSAKIEITKVTGKAICGTANGKNRMGGYAGAQPFIVLKDKDIVDLYTGPPTMGEVRELALTDTHDPSWDKQYDAIGFGCDYPRRAKEFCGETYAEPSDSICPTWRTQDGPTQLMARARE